MILPIILGKMNIYEINAEMTFDMNCLLAHDMYISHSRPIAVIIQFRWRICPRIVLCVKGSAQGVSPTSQSTPRVMWLISCIVDNNRRSPAKEKQIEDIPLVISPE